MSAGVAPPAGAHGGDGARLAAALDVSPDEVLDLSLSLNPCAPDVTALVEAHARAIRRYPDVGAATDALADAIGAEPARVLLTNGGAEAIALVAAEHPIGYVDEPDFSLYARHLERIESGAPRWRSNPHNPTGRLAHRDERAAVWDEAFYPLATGCWTRADQGALVVGSLTKVFACPGLRMGYVVAPDEDAARRIAARQPEWSVNALACAAIPELLTGADIAGWAREIAQLRSRLVDLLAAVGLEAEPSDAPFVLVPHAKGVRDHLARAGVLVRDTASFGWRDGIRVAVPDDRERGRLADALAGWSP